MNIGLVISGGMAKGAYEIGVLKAIDEFFPKDGSIRFDLSSSSIGVLNSYCFVNGRIEQAIELWKRLALDGTRPFIGNIMRSSFLQQCIKDICLPTDRLHQPFYATLLDITQNVVSIKYLNMQHVDPLTYRYYLKASIAMPLYNNPVVIKGRKYFDGAMADNIPTHPLMHHNLDLIICLHFDNCSYTFEDPYFDNKILTLTYHSPHVIADAVKVTPERIHTMLKTGYSDTRQALENVFACGFEDLDTIYHNLEVRNREKKIVRISGDTVTTNINKIAQKLTKRKVLS